MAACTLVLPSARGLSISPGGVVPSPRPGRAAVGSWKGSVRSNGGSTTGLRRVRAGAAAPELTCARPRPLGPAHGGHTAGAWSSRTDAFLAGILSRARPARPWPEAMSRPRPPAALPRSYGDAIGNEALAIQATPRGVRLRHLRRAGPPAHGPPGPPPVGVPGGLRSRDRVPLPLLHRQRGLAADLPRAGPASGSPQHHAGPLLPQPQPPGRPHVSRAQRLRPPRAETGPGDSELNRQGS
jgi:hypothetical protein